MNRTNNSSRLSHSVKFLTSDILPHWLGNTALLSVKLEPTIKKTPVKEITTQDILDKTNAANRDRKTVWKIANELREELVNKINRTKLKKMLYQQRARNRQHRKKEKNYTTSPDGKKKIFCF